MLASVQSLALRPRRSGVVGLMVADGRENASAWSQRVEGGMSSASAVSQPVPQTRRDLRRRRRWTRAVGRVGLADHR